MTATAYIVLALCALANGALLRRPHLDGRIVGGKDASIEHYPYQVSLRKYGFHICGGTLISVNWVLTAAHCVYGARPTSISFRAGSSIRDSGGSPRQVGQIIQHEQYNPTTMDYDFALIKVHKPYILEEAIQPIRLADNEPAAGANSLISGWGSTSSGGSLQPNLQVANVPIVDRAQCNERYSAYGGITARMICAGSDEDCNDVCHGDSGGPLVVGANLVGVVSWGFGCAAAGYPSVYSNVANQRAWIKMKIGV